MADDATPKPRPESSAQKMRRLREREKIRLEQEDLVTTLSEDLIEAGFLKPWDAANLDAIKAAMKQAIEKIQGVTGTRAI